MAYARRTDSTHRAIVKALQQLGWLVFDTSRLGGFVDLVIARGGVVKLVEVKTPTGKLRASQEAFIALGWPVQIVRSVAEAVEL